MSLTLDNILPEVVDTFLFYLLSYECIFCANNAPEMGNARGLAGFEMASNLLC